MKTVVPYKQPHNVHENLAEFDEAAWQQTLDELRHEPRKIPRLLDEQESE